uniref:Uncharacterized protein n=1 Tax=Arundo donax TaxID=35708 RepID=A0A0A9FY45_ARUDO
MERYVVLRILEKKHTSEQFRIHNFYFRQQRSLALGKEIIGSKHRSSPTKRRIFSVGSISHRSQLSLFV